MGIGPMTSSLPKKCSAAELSGHNLRPCERSNYVHVLVKCESESAG